MVVVDIRASDEEDARPALQRAEGDVPADLCRKGRDSGILADEALRVWVTSSRMASSRVRERVDMKCVSWGKGDGSVAGASDLRASLLQSATLSVLSKAAPFWFGLKRSVLCPFRDLSRLSFTRLMLFPSFFLGLPYPPIAVGKQADAIPGKQPRQRNGSPPLSFPKASAAIM